MYWEHATHNMYGACHVGFLGCCPSFEARQKERVRDLSNMFSASGKLQCIWSMYQDRREYNEHEILVINDLQHVGDADSEETFADLITSACVLRQAGTTFILRKHIQPIWEEHMFSGHFRVEKPIAGDHQQSSTNSFTVTSSYTFPQPSAAGSSSSSASAPTSAQVNWDDIYAFVNDVIQERVKPNVAVEGVGVSVQQHRVILSLWLTTTDSQVVSSILQSLKRLPGPATIRFFHHRNISKKLMSAGEGKRTLMPLLLMLDSPGINTSELPRLDEPLTGPSSPSSRSKRRNSTDDYFGVTAGTPVQTSFNVNENVLNVTSGNSISFFDPKTSTESGLVVPTPVADWTTGWSPSQLVAAQTNQPLPVASGRASASTEGSAVRDTPTAEANSTAATPIQFVSVPGGTVMSFQMSPPTSGGSGANSGSLSSSISPPTQFVVASQPIPVGGGSPVGQGAPGMAQHHQQTQQQVMSHHQLAHSMQSQVYSVQQQQQQQSYALPTQYTQSQATYHTHPYQFTTVAQQPQQTMQQQQHAPQHGQQYFQSQQPQVSYQATFFSNQYQPSAQSFGTNFVGGGGSQLQHAPQLQQQQLQQPQQHQRPPIHFSNHPEMGGDFSSVPHQQVMMHSSPPVYQQHHPSMEPQYVEYRPQGNSYSHTGEPSAQMQGLPLVHTPYAPISTPPPQHQGPQSTSQMRYSNTANVVSSVRPGYKGHGGAPPQSDRKAFVHGGKVYPPGMNRKEYRLIVHHSEDLGPAYTHPSAFPCPRLFPDGEIERELYEELKTEALLLRVRI